MTPEQLLAAVLFSETKDLKDAEGIANVVINRSMKPNRFGKTLEEVIYTPSQFSGVGTAEWNKAVNQKFVNKKEENIYKDMLSIAYRARSGKLSDVTNGADHYVNLKLAHPKWADLYDEKAKIGEHTYFKETIIKKK